MPGEQTGKLVEVGGALYIHLPTAFARAHSLHRGETVGLLFDDALLVVPHPDRPGPQVRRLRGAFAEPETGRGRA